MEAHYMMLLIYGACSYGQGRGPLGGLLMKQVGTIWSILVGDHPGIIPIKFGQISISSLGGEVVWSCLYIIQCKIVTPGLGPFLSKGHGLNNFGRGPLVDVTYLIQKLWPL